MLKWLRGEDPIEAAAASLYAAVSTQARAPHLYIDLRVADTVDGRLEMLLLHLAVVMDRLGRIAPKGQAVAMALTEAFVTHMDDTLRHVGVGDLAVPRKVKKAAAALYDAHQDYAQALTATEDAPSAWRHALHLHLISRGTSPAADIPALADYAQQWAARLKSMPDSDLLAGRMA